ANVSEVARIANDLDVTVRGGDSRENGEGRVPGGIVYEYVLITVASDRLHQSTHPFIDLAHITFFVETGSYYADCLHTNEPWAAAPDFCIAGRVSWGLEAMPARR